MICPCRCRISPDILLTCSRSYKRQVRSICATVEDLIPSMPKSHRFSIMLTLYFAYHRGLAPRLFRPAQHVLQSKMVRMSTSYTCSYVNSKVLPIELRSPMHCDGHVSELFHHILLQSSQSFLGIIQNVIILAYGKSHPILG